MCNFLKFDIPFYTYWYVGKWGMGLGLGLTLSNHLKLFIVQVIILKFCNLVHLSDSTRQRFSFTFFFFNQEFLKLFWPPKFWVFYVHAIHSWTKIQYFALKGTCNTLCSSDSNISYWLLKYDLEKNLYLKSFLYLWIPLNP